MSNLKTGGKRSKIKHDVIRIKCDPYEKKVSRAPPPPCVTGDEEECQPLTVLDKGGALQEGAVCRF